MSCGSQRLDVFEEQESQGGQAGGNAGGWREGLITRGLAGHSSQAGREAPGGAQSKEITRSGHLIFLKPPPCCMYNSRSQIAL